MKLSKLLPLLTLATLALCLGEARALVGVEVKLWMPEAETEFESTTSVLEGTKVSLEDDLNLDSEDDIPYIKIWFGSSSHRIVVSRMKVELSGDDLPDLAVDFGGETFVLGVSVESKLEATIWRIAWESDWVNTSFVRFGTILGTEILDVKVSLENSLIGSESEEFTAPVPIIGLQGEITLPLGIGIYGEVAGLHIASGGFEGSFVEYEVGLKYGLAGGRIYATAGYRALSIDMEDGDDKGEIGFKGFIFGVGAKF